MKKKTNVLLNCRWHSLLIGRNFSSENKTKTFSIPHCDVSVKQVNLAKVNYLFEMLKKLSSLL